MMDSKISRKSTFQKFEIKISDDRTCFSHTSNFMLLSYVILDENGEVVLSVWFVERTGCKGLRQERTEIWREFNAERKSYRSQ